VDSDGGRVVAAGDVCERGIGSERGRLEEECSIRLYNSSTHAAPAFFSTSIIHFIPIITTDHYLVMGHKTRCQSRVCTVRHRQERSD